MNAFLETTTVVDLLFKDKATVEPIREILQKYTVKYSSQYVRMEIKRGVLRHFVYLHNKAVECKKLSEVQACITSLSSSPQRNKLSTILKAVEDFFREFEKREMKPLPVGQRPTEFQKTMLAAFLRTRIKRFWTAFERLVDVVIDDVECYKHGYTLRPPKLVGQVFDNTFSNCDLYKPGICRLRSFCDENETSLVTIRDQLEETKSPDIETQKRLKEIRDVLRVKKRDILRKTCWRMGDAVIILEAPEDAEIINGNCKHYDPMCKAVGKTSVCYK